ncbi:hypothetical protein [Chamaesiphon sp. OTE_75_metabat_556]|uniref:hypothetical protein n=1 Tax=Chamaesiphon sp. OTE_75_metabat_556 TaxID=2964692 RepID=UPI00286C35EE|nr:hypothetical protein [Chamaesiphon sp. OTE_75_metabat_556]
MSSVCVWQGAPLANCVRQEVSIFEVPDPHLLESNPILNSNSNRDRLQLFIDIYKD